MQITDVIGRIPYRIALAGGWIDQPFISPHSPSLPGSMVVISLEPTYRFMDRCGMGTSTRKMAMELWGDELPKADPAGLVQELYYAENKGQAEPSGSQDMAGLIYPGVNRLDYDFNFEGGAFPCHVESNNDPNVAAWLEEVSHILPVEPRPARYNPLGIKNLDTDWIHRLGKSGKDCFQAILHQNLVVLGKLLNECMLCREAILPNTVQHHTLTVDLPGILGNYQSIYAGAMYSGCGGGYLFIVLDRPVPGTFQTRIRLIPTAVPPHRLSMKRCG